MIECRAAEKRHCLGGLGQGGIVIGELCKVEIVRLGKELRWLGHLIELIFCDLMHLLEF